MSQLSQINGVKSLAAFLRSVNKAHDAHMADIEQARKEVPIEAQARRIHAEQWEACQRPTDTTRRVPPAPPTLMQKAIAHTRAGIMLGGLQGQGEMCSFRLYAPEPLRLKVLGSVAAVWGTGAVITITAGIIRVTVPRQHVTARRETLRSLLAFVATAKAAA